MAFQPPPTGAPPPISSQPPASAPPPATAPPPPMSAPPSTGTPPPVSAPPQLLAGLQPPSTTYPPMLKVAEGYCVAYQMFHRPVMRVYKGDIHYNRWLSRVARCHRSGNGENSRVWFCKVYDAKIFSSGHLFWMVLKSKEEDSS